MSLRDLISGKYGLNNLQGPVGIVTVISESAQKSGFDIGYLLDIAMLISVNVGIFNLLPLPALDGGRLVFAIGKPCVLAVSSGINKPRFINAMGIIKAKKKPLTVWSNEDLGLDMDRIGLQGSPTQPGELITPHMERSSEVLGTDPEEAADKIIALMKKAGGTL